MKLRPLPQLVVLALALTPSPQPLVAADFTQATFPDLMVAPIPERPRTFAWCDYDNDGDLDFIQAGARLTQLWRNDGSTFSKVEIPGLPQAGSGSVTWFDWNHDGWMDFIHSGIEYDPVRDENTPITHLWQNTCTGSFTRVLNLNLPQVYSGDISVADYDLDGRPDLLIMGLETVNQFPEITRTGLWRNTGTGFEEVTIAGLPRVQTGNLAWADYDGDGRPDFLLTGRYLDAQEQVTLSTQLWKNEPTGFRKVDIPGMLQFWLGQVVWSDFNQDGKPDFLIAGLGNNESGNYMMMTRLWTNNAAGNFKQRPIFAFPTDLGGSLAAMDYDNDGRLDFLVSGARNTEKTQLWRNNGSTFVSVSGLTLPKLFGASTAIADYDHDGRMDLLIGGFAGRGVNYAIYTQLWRGTSPATNAPPTPPTLLTTETTNGLTWIRWNAGTDDHTPAISLTYNLRIGTTPGGVDVVSPESDPQSGYRRIPAHGNAGWRLESGVNLAPGAYYMAVQSIDANLAGSVFSSELKVDIRPELRWVTRGGERYLQWTQLDATWVLESSETFGAGETVWVREVSGTAGEYGLRTSEARRFYRLRQKGE